MTLDPARVADRNCWIGVVSRSHVQIGVNGGFIQLNHGKKAPLQKFRAGDGLIVYSPRTDYPNGEPLQSFTAIGSIASGEIYQLEMAPNRLLYCLLGAAAGISLALSLAGPPVSPFLLASLGGSAVFLFGLTRAPAAQSRALIGGHVGGALIGIACYQCFGESLWVYALAQALTLGYMLLTPGWFTIRSPGSTNRLRRCSGELGATRQ